MGGLPIIDVDENGIDANGMEYVWAPDPRAVASGLVTSRSVRLRYPDGTLKEAIEVLITEKGLADLAKHFNQPLH